jgi:hypothetical protein
MFLGTPGPADAVSLPLAKQTPCTAPSWTGLSRSAEPAGWPPMTLARTRTNTASRYETFYIGLSEEQRRGADQLLTLLFGF